MKPLLLSTLLILFSITSFSQNLIEKRFAFTQEVQVNQVDQKGGILQPEFVMLAQPGHIFYIKGLSDDKKSYVIKFLNFNSNSSQDEGEQEVKNYKNSRFNQEPNKDDAPPIVDYRANGHYFLISSEDFTNKSTDQFTYKNSFIVLSGMILPYKLNFGNKQPGSRFDFGKNITIGPAFGWRHRTSKTSLGKQAINFLGIAGISTIQVDSKTLPGLVTEPTNYGALTLGGGIAYEFDKIQLGIFSGLDILTGEANRAYVYRKSPWLSFGIGFQIFSFKAAGAGN